MEAQNDCKRGTLACDRRTAQTASRSTSKAAIFMKTVDLAAEYEG